MINQIDPLSQFTWWSSLKHGGLLIAPARLAHYFSTDKPRLSSYWAERLRSGVQAQQDAEKLGAQAALLDTVLEGILQLPALEWRRAPSAPIGGIASSRGRTSNPADSGWEATELCCRYSTTTSSRLVSAPAGAALRA
jgi:hypothetical protein